MGEKIKRIKRIKNIRLHREGTNILLCVGCGLLAAGALIWYLCGFNMLLKIYIFLMVILYGVMVNFFRCPIRYFNGPTENIVVAPADGRVVVIEEVEEDEYFHDKRLMVSIFMSLFNVHANWFPVDGKVKFVRHFNGNYHKAWLPKASEENEHADIMLESDNGQEILCRQVAGAVARRIVTYAKEGEDCYIDEHVGFIKFGSRVDVYLPIDSEICVKMGQSTTGDQTVIAKLK